MNLKAMLIACVAGWLLAGTALSGDAVERVSIRLVEATHQGKTVSSELADVSDLLRSNLNYQSFILIDSEDIALPSRGDKIKLGPLTIELQGYPTDLYIKIHQGKRKLMQTSVALDRDAPLILGGFPSPNGKYVLIFLGN